MKSHHDLLQQVESLTETLRDLGTRLLQAVDDLQELGMPPSEMLIEQQLAARKAFVDVQVEILSLAKSMGVLPVSGPDAVTSVRELKSLLQATAEAEEKRGATEETRRRALEVLDATLRIAHRDTPDLPALLQCYARARELRGVIVEAPWTDMPPEVQALAQGTHPFSALLTLVERFEELDDTQWQSLYGTIAGAFDQTLMTAALRRKLVFQAEVPSQEPPASPASHDEHLVSVPPNEPSSPTVTEFPTASSEQARTAEESEASLFTEAEEVKAGEEQTVQDFLTEPFPDVEETRIPETEPSAVSHPAEKETPPLTLPSSHQEQLLAPANISWPTPSQAESLFPIQVEAQEKEEPEGGRPPLSRFGPDDTAQHIATFILNGSAQDRPAALRDLVWRLICEDKLALAFHTARCTEELYPDLHLLPPAWLVRAVTVSRQVCHANEF